MAPPLNKDARGYAKKKSLSKSNSKKIKKTASPERAAAETTAEKEPQVQQKPKKLVCPDCGSSDFNRTAWWDSGSNYRCNSCRRRWAQED